MAFALAPVIRQRFFDANGNPLSAGKLFTYAAGSGGAINKPTYTTPDGGAANTNPVELDAEGYADICLSDDGPYLLVLRDSLDNLIWSRDNITVSPFTIIQSVPYLKTVSDIINGEEVVIDRFLPQQQIPAIRAGTSTYDIAPDINNALSAVGPKGIGIYAKYGKYYQRSALVIPGSTTIRGDGRETIFTTDLDIEQFTVKPPGQYHLTFRDFAVINKVPIRYDIPAFGFTGTTTAGSPIIEGVSGATSLEKGMVLTGPGIPPGSFVGKVVDDRVWIAQPTQGYIPTFVNATAGGSSIFQTFYGEGATKFHFYLNNAGNTKFLNMYVEGNYGDIAYSPRNMGGIWFDRDSGQQYFINTIDNCWIDHCRVIMGTSDSNIKNSVIYGIGGDYAVKLCAPGLTVSGCNVSNGQIACIFITLTGKEAFGALNHAIVGNNIDGGGLWQSGYGIYAVRPTSAVISGNKINITPKAGAYLLDPFGVAITGNLFFETNQDSAAFSDVEIACNAFQPFNNTVSGNVFTQNAPKAAPGWAIREVNLGSYPFRHSYCGNNISPFYLLPAFKIVTPPAAQQGPNISGNAGSLTEAGLFGTFVPSLVGTATPGAPVYSVRNATYALSNNVLSFRLTITTTGLGGLAGAVEIEGLPVPANSVDAVSVQVGSYEGYSFTGGRTQMGAIIEPGNTKIKLVQMGSGISRADVQAPAAASSISVSGSYQIN